MIDSLAWWEEKEKKHEAVLLTLERIKQAQDYRRLNDQLHLGLYGNNRTDGFSPYAFGRATPRVHARLSLNVVKNMISAVVSKIAAKNNIKPKFMTYGGDYSLKRRAEGLEQFGQGLFYQQKTYRKQRAVFTDCLISGTGPLKIYNQHDTLNHERTPWWEINVDDADGFNKDPRCMYQEKWYDRAVLAKIFPDKSDEIKKAGTFSSDAKFVDHSKATSNLVPVVEAWHLPSIPGADDGCRAICIQGADLLTEPYKENYLPFAVMRWNDDPMGYFGTGLAYELAGIQCEINSLLLDIQRAHKLIKGHWSIPENAKINLRHINDDLAALVKYAGVEPRYYAPSAVAPDVYQHLWNLYAKAYEISGVSQLSASSIKPAGLESAVAIREYGDLQTERFLEAFKMLEDWTMDVMDQSIDRAREISNAKGFKVNAVSREFIKEIDFKDVDMERDSYVLQVFPSSFLPSTPAGKMEWVENLLNSPNPIIDPIEALEAIGMPDTKSITDRKLAPRRIIERNIESIVSDGKFVPPEPLDNHDLAITMLNESLALARLDGVPAERLTMMRNYIAQSVRQKNLPKPGETPGDASGAAPPPQDAPPASPGPPMPPGA